MSTLSVTPFHATVDGKEITVVGIVTTGTLPKFVIIKENSDGTVVPVIVPSIRDLETEAPANG